MTKNRKDLDDISEVTRLPLRRVTRQFDNLKRIISAIEEKQCNIYTFIETHYTLNKSLARKYTCIIFLILGRFNVVTKKRLCKLPCEQLELCAAITLACLIPDRVTYLMNMR